MCNKNEVGVNMSMKERSKKYRAGRIVGIGTSHCSQ